MDVDVDVHVEAAVDPTEVVVAEDAELASSLVLSVLPCAISRKATMNNEKRFIS